MTSETAEARDLLLQAVTPIAEDLVRVFDRLNAARRAVGLYQEDHPIAVGARDEACMALEDALRERGTISITTTEIGMLIDGKAYRQTADTESLAKRLRQRGILSLILKAGIDPTEISVLLSAMDLSATRLRAKGGIRHILETAGVTHIEVEEIHFAEEQPPPEEQPQPKLAEPSAQWDEIIAAVAKLLVSDSDEFDDESYDKLLQVLGDATLAMRLLIECLSQAGSQLAEGGRAAFAGQMVQKIERVVVTRSFEEWEKVKPTVRQAVAKLPPAIRPRIFTFHPSGIGQGPPSPDEVVASPGHERLPGLLAELNAALAEARNLPKELADAFVGLERGDQALGLIGADARVPASRLAMLLNGMASMKLPPVSAWEEMTDLLQSARGQTTLGDAVVTLLEILEKENKLDGYSKVAGELERKTKELMDRGQRTAALTALASFARHANEGNGYPAWQRLRAKAALEAIGTTAILQFVGQVVRTATPEQGLTAAELLVFLGDPAVPLLTQLMGEPLAPGVEAAVEESLVRLGEAAVPELCRGVQSGYTKVGQAAVRVLSRIGTPSALVGLRKALGARDVLVRLAAVEALGRTKSSEAAQLLLVGVADRHPSIRRATIAALGDLGSPQAVPDLSRLAQRVPPLFGGGGDNGDQMEAICALGKIGGGQAIPALSQVLKRRVLFGAAKMDEIRLAAATALRRIGTAECLDVLAGHTNDKRPAVRSACLQMFEELSAGQSTPPG